MEIEDWLIWADRAYFGAGTIAAIATAITVVAGFAQNRISGRISDAKDRLLAQYQSAASVQIATANAKAAEANRSAVTARGEISIASERILELSQENLKLEGIVAPRRIRAFFLEAESPLRKRAQGKTVRISSYSLDVESAVLGEQLIALFEWLGFGVQDDRMAHGALMSISTGIFVSGVDHELVLQVVNQLQELSLATIEGSVAPSPGFSAIPSGRSEPDLTVFIGVKPLSQH